MLLDEKRIVHKHNIVLFTLNAQMTKKVCGLTTGLEHALDCRVLIRV